MRLTEKELAARWGLHPGTLAHWRSKGIGPQFVKLGRSVRYRVADVEEYERKSESKKA